MLLLVIMKCKKEVPYNMGQIAEFFVTLGWWIFGISLLALAVSWGLYNGLIFPAIQAGNGLLFAYLGLFGIIGLIMSSYLLYNL